LSVRQKDGTLENMATYSSDLRERVIALAQQSDLTQPQLAALFSVGLSTVEQWLRVFRHVGRTTPLPHAGGAPRVLQPHTAVLRQLVQHYPDATLQELCDHLAAQTGVRANPSMMCRELQLLALPRKKVTARQSARNAARPNDAPTVSRPHAGDAPRHRRAP
jgi:transposase